MLWLRALPTHCSARTNQAPVGTWNPPCKDTGGFSISLPCPPLSPHAGVGEEVRSQRQRVVGEDGVIRGAGAGSVLTGGRVLLEGHGEVQVLQGGMVP